jgi:hypothetical protein
LVAFYFLHFLLFLGLATWIGQTVAPFLEGHLVALLHPRSLEQVSKAVGAALIWSPLIAAVLVLVLAGLRKQQAPAPTRLVRLSEVVAVLLVTAALILHRPIGGLLVGGGAVVAALYLANHAIFMLAVGLTALTRAIGSPLRIAAMTVPAFALGLASGDVQGWLGLPAGTIEGQSSNPVWAMLAHILFVGIIMGLGDPAFAVPIALGAIGHGLEGSWWGAAPCRIAFWALAFIAITTRAARWALELRRTWIERSQFCPSSLAPSPDLVASRPPAPRRLAVLVTGTNPVASLALLLGSAETATERLLQVWDDIIAPNDFPSAEELLDVEGSRLTRDRVVTVLRQTFGREKARDRSLFGPEAIAVGDRRTPMQAALESDGEPYNLICRAEDDNEAAVLRTGLRLIRYLTTRAPCAIARTKDQAGWAASQRDTAFFLVQLALALKEAGLHDDVTIYLQANKYANRRVDPLGDKNPNAPGGQYLLDGSTALTAEYAERMALAAYLRIISGVACEVTYTHSFDGCKAAAQNGHSGSLDSARWAYVLDRNCQCFTLRELIDDIRRITGSPELVAISPMRSTPNLAFPVGSQADLAEYGFSVFTEALVNDLGGDRGEFIGTGWGNLVALPQAELSRAFADPNFPYRFNPRERGAARWFGAIYGMSNSPHLSEDYVQVIGAAEQLKSLGHLPRTGVGKAIHYKLREQVSFLEFRDSRPRWTGGGDPGQKGRDPLLQRLREFGSDSVFAREMQKNRGRYYLMAPLAMVNVLLASMLVLTGYAPFTGISVLFWIGLACNQALTLNGLASYVRRAGAWSGLAIWLSQRFRDIMLLPPLAFIEMNGVLTALSKGIRIGFVFKTSGRSEVGQDSPIAKSLAADPGTYRSVAVLVATGLLGTVLNLFAISQLDLGNVVMLYPSLVFIEGLALGAFIYWGRRGPGRSVLGVTRWAPKLLGFVVGLVAVTSFALGVGVARDVEWRDIFGHRAIAGWLAPMPPHVAVLSLSAALVFWMLPARSALAGMGDAQRQPGVPLHRGRTLSQWHNLGVVGCWVVAVLLSAWLGLWSEGLTRGGLIAALFFAAAGLAKLIDLIRAVRMSKEPQVTQNYFRATILRSAIVTVGATIWFVVVPVPAQFSFQFLDYSLTFSVVQLGQALLLSVEVLAVIFGAGVVASALTWRTLRSYYQQLHRQYHARMLESEAAPAVTAVVEAALEGYLVARDSYAPITAAWMLSTADRALDVWDCGHSLFHAGQPAPRRPAAASYRLLRFVCER